MYKLGSKQISLSDFGQPVGMHLKKNNRWVKKAQLIPWEEIEKQYAKLFSNNKGNVAKSARLAVGACIIQAEYGYSDEETALQIQETAYLQYFCGYTEYDDSKLPFDPSLMVYFRKRLTPEILGEINELIIAKASEQTDDNSDDDSNNSGNLDEEKNKGTMIVDATCAPSNIKYPRDTDLLNKARECTEKIIDELHDPSNGKKPRTYRQRAHKDYMKFARCRRPGSKKAYTAVGKQINYLRRNLKTIEDMVANGKEMQPKRSIQLETICALYEQQKYMHDNKKHTVENRIVSLSQPHIRPIVRGKVKAPVEFGAKLDISVIGGWTRLETLSFDAYNEATKLVEMLERYKDREGHYPERVLADKIYRNRKNLEFCKERNIRLAGPALGRPKKDAQVDRKQNYIDERERIEVERKFSLAKRKCGMGLIMTKLSETATHSIAMSILVLNLRKMQGTFLRLCDFAKILAFFNNKWASDLKQTEYLIAAAQ